MQLARDQLLDGVLAAELLSSLALHADPIFQSYREENTVVVGVQRLRVADPLSGDDPDKAGISPEQVSLIIERTVDVEQLRIGRLDALSQQLLALLPVFCREHVHGGVALVLHGEEAGGLDSISREPVGQRLPGGWVVEGHEGIPLSYENLRFGLGGENHDVIFVGRPELRVKKRSDRKSMKVQFQALAKSRDLEFGEVFFQQGLEVLQALGKEDGRGRLQLPQFQQRIGVKVIGV